MDPGWSHHLAEIWNRNKSKAPKAGRNVQTGKKLNIGKNGKTSGWNTFTNKRKSEHLAPIPEAK